MLIQWENAVGFTGLKWFCFWFTGIKCLTAGQEMSLVFQKSDHLKVLCYCIMKAVLHDTVYR